MSKQQQHQDWEPVVFNKKPAAKTGPATTPTVSTTSSSLASVGIYAAASDDDLKKNKIYFKKYFIGC